ncbi:hypothetical protein COT77_00845 [Candidatus Berkelbacteria bacterium CG10_big_fil_rev_8_21_14_0_10_41_12]|uniref:Uncharacterized protein n=1 Tax=Candidatus Berkelbacteria bacterium CG10_big_fil_rev_8_21_14_0_10_41_12 TaxID=1974513 RepID=A0A2M6WXP0_9BACT|nr:MAG: hypothetical protein COT77_00845 [Candidatus Berkelbacteria bacterium CG10_big_fil_rev_8_21_14_0_10_41_12]
MKMKSSAMLIALMIGIIISGAVATISTLISINVKSAGQIRDGKSAYYAAYSGIQEGVLMYQYAVSQNKLNALLSQNNLFTITRDINPNDPRDPSFEAKIEINPLSIGLVPDGAMDSGPAQEGPKLNIDDSLDLILETGQYARFYWSDPMKKNGTGLADYQTIINYQMFNDSANGEQQIMQQRIITQRQIDEPSQYYVNIGPCSNGTNFCRLRITARIKPRNSSVFDYVDKFNGQGQGAGNFIYYAINPGNDNNSDYNLAITSIGKAGLAQRKLIAKFNTITGKYVSLFDYAIYCGDKCEGI